MSATVPTDPYRRFAIPNGVNGVRATLNLMVRLVHAGRKEPAVIALAEQITRTCPNSVKAQVTALFHWVKANVRYVRDPRDVEKISTAERLLRVRVGDCDDMAVLLASLLESVGNRTRFVALGFDGGEYSHVVSEVRLGNAWVMLDPTVPVSTVGWIPPGSTRYMVRHV